MNIQCIGLDADDTLWECGKFYAGVENGFKNLIADNSSWSLLDIQNRLNQFEAKNMEALGYGAKAMTISMIETAFDINPAMPGNVILKIIELGKSLLATPVHMLPHVEDTIRELQKRFRVVIITQGDLREQNRKFDLSPIPKNIGYFVLSEKTPANYLRLLKQEDIDPSHFLMVGDSPKSDIYPVIEIGGYAAWLPSSGTWAHEIQTKKAEQRHFELSNIQELLTLLK